MLVLRKALVTKTIDVCMYLWCRAVGRGEGVRGEGVRGEGGRLAGEAGRGGRLLCDRRYGRGLTRAAPTTPADPSRRRLEVVLETVAMETELNVQKQELRYCTCMHTQWTVSNYAQLWSGYSATSTASTHCTLRPGGCGNYTHTHTEAANKQLWL